MQRIRSDNGVLQVRVVKSDTELFSPAKPNFKLFLTEVFVERRHGHDDLKAPWIGFPHSG
jgi:hypothetical protein